MIYQTVQVQAINHYFTCAQVRLLTRKIEQRVARTAISPARTEPTGAFGRVDRRSVTDFWSKRILSARSDGARRKSRLPARIVPASARENQANRGSPVLRTTNGESRCCADSGEARPRRKEARHLAASRREQSSPRRRRRGMAAMRIGYEASRRFARDRSFFGHRWEETGSVARARVGSARLFRDAGAAAPPSILATRRAAPRRLAVASHAPHGAAAPAAAAACFRQFSRQKSCSSVLCDNTQKAWHATFPLRARDVSGHRRRFA